MTNINKVIEELSYDYERVTYKGEEGSYHVFECVIDNEWHNETHLVRTDDFKWLDVKDAPNRGWRELGGI